MNKIITILPVCLLLSSCANEKIRKLPPENYPTASDFALASVKKTSCMGKIDAYLFSAGNISENKGGHRSFVANSYNDTHCSRDDFKQIMGAYCQHKGGHYEGDWCVKNSVPVFKVEVFNITERGLSQSQSNWEAQANNNGFKTEDERREENQANQVRLKEENEQASQVKRAEQARRNSVTHAGVGDMICSDDVESHTPLPIYYAGYIERRENGKIQIRIVFHGRKASSFNDGIPTYDDGYRGDHIIWSSPKGWYACDKDTINQLP